MNASAFFYQHTYWLTLPFSLYMPRILQLLANIGDFICMILKIETPVFTIKAHLDHKRARTPQYFFGKHHKR